MEDREKVCAWCGEPIRRGDAPYTTEHGWKLLKYHPGECANAAKQQNSSLCRKRNKPFGKIAKSKTKEQIRLLTEQNQLLMEQNKNLKSELKKRGWM